MPHKPAALLVSALLVSAMWACAPSEEVDVLFCQASPGSCGERVVALIDGAQRTLEVAAYSFTHAEIGDALQRAAERGVDVWVVYDQRQRNASGDMDTILRGLEALEARVQASHNPSAMHHKFMVFDAGRVATGSFNFTNNGDWNNDENLVVISQDEIAYRFRVEFQRLWEGQ